MNHYIERGEATVALFVGLGVLDAGGFGELGYCAGLNEEPGLSVCERSKL